jgi:hypothetical protein
MAAFGAESRRGHDEVRQKLVEFRQEHQRHMQELMAGAARFDSQLAAFGARLGTLEATVDATYEILLGGKQEAAHAASAAHAELMAEVKAVGARLGAVEQGTQHMEEHIEMVNGVYECVRNPLSALARRFGADALPRPRLTAPAAPGPTDGIGAGITDV